MTKLGTTPSQTVGPFLSIGLSWDDGELAVAANARGAIWLTGLLVDGNGDPVPDGLIETWQADPAGRFDHPADARRASVEQFRGFARAATNADGEWRICTLKPGTIPAEDEQTEAPHLDVSVFARGLQNRLITRIYFADEQAANAADPVLLKVDPDRRATLIAKPTVAGYQHQIVLQGDRETVFFAL